MIASRSWHEHMANEELRTALAVGQLAVRTGYDPERVAVEVERHVDASVLHTLAASDPSRSEEAQEASVAIYRGTTADQRSARIRLSK